MVLVGESVSHVQKQSGAQNFVYFVAQLAMQLPKQKISQAAIILTV